MAEPEINERALGEALGVVMSRHPALRMRFTEGGGGRWSQYCPRKDEARGTRAPLAVVDVAGVPREGLTRVIEQAASQAQSSLDIREGRMLRAVLFECGEGEPARLLVVIHHLVVDGVSWRVLLEDWQAAYEQLRGGRAAGEVELPEPTTSFAEWARRLEEFARTEEVKAELDYWLGVGEADGGVRGVGGEFALPVDFEEGENRERDASHVSVALAEDETRALLREVPAAYHTEVNDALLCALGRALWRWTGSARPVVELEGHGREDFAEDIDTSRTVGWFATIFPVELEAGGSVGDDLKAVKERLRRVPRRGLGYGLLRYGGGEAGAALEAMAERGGGVLFNYTGQLDGAVSGGSMFRGARESAGRSVWGGGWRTHLITVGASVFGGRLMVTWGYGRKLHRRETIEGVAGWMAEELRALVAHCREEGADGFTPSDFPLSRLSQAQVDRLTRQRGRGAGG